VNRLCCAELADDIKPPDGAGFPLWLVIVLMLAALSLIVVSLIIILRRLTTTPVAAVRGPSFVKMESGGSGRWNLPRPQLRVWKTDPSLPSMPHTVINVPAVSVAGCYMHSSSGGRARGQRSLMSI